MKELKFSLIGAAVGAISTALFFGINTDIPEKEFLPAPEVRQVDQSLVLEKAIASAPVPRMATPKGSKVTRQQTVTVRPASAPAECPDVEVDLDTVTDKEGVTRVVASSPNGLILSGKDTLILPSQNKNAWLAGGGIVGGKPAIAFGKEISPNLVGIGAVSGTSRKDIAVSAMIMWKF